MYLKKIELSFFFISLFRFVFYFFPSIFFISVYFVLFSLISFCFRWFPFISFSFRWFRFVSFRFCWFRFVSFRFVFVDFVSFHFVSFLFRFALYRYPIIWSQMSDLKKQQRKCLLIIWLPYKYKLWEISNGLKGILSTKIVIFFMPNIIVVFRTDLHKMKINTKLCCKRYDFLTKKKPKLSLSELLSWMTIFKSIHMAFYVNTSWACALFRNTKQHVVLGQKRKCQLVE